MANAIRSRTIQKGIDPRGFSLVAFGGAGPLHGAEVAAMLEIPEVIVPVYPGITSALGLLTTDLKYDAIKTEFQVRGAVDLAGLNEDFRSMEADLARQFTADGLAPSEVSFTRWADLRYVGQGYELRVAMAAGAVDPAGLEGAWQRFHDLHHAEYGQSFPSSPIEIVNIRVSGVGRMPRIGALRAPCGTSLALARVKSGRCVFRVNGALTQLDTAFYRRDRLPVDEVIAGPAIVLQADSTTLIPPGSSARADQAGNLLIAIGGSHE
jgi:N-methylhydantoinase A